MAQKREQRAAIHPRNFHRSLYAAPKQHEANTCDSSERSGVSIAPAYTGAR